METPKKEVPVAQLGANQMKAAEFICTHYVAKIAPNTKIEALATPEFWAHHAQMLKPWDEITAHAEDGTWMAKLLVLDVSRTWAKVKVLAHYPLGTKDVSLTQAEDANVNAELRAECAKYELKYRGVHKWSVVRISDAAVVAEGFQVKGDAGQKLVEIAGAALTGGVATATS